MDRTRGRLGGGMKKFGQKTMAMLSRVICVMCAKAMNFEIICKLMESERVKEREREEREREEREKRTREVAEGEERAQHHTEREARKGKEETGSHPRWVTVCENSYLQFCFCFSRSPREKETRRQRESAHTKRERERECVC
jgi:hypothetical protein